MSSAERFWLGWRLTGLFFAGSLPWGLFFVVRDLLNNHPLQERRITFLSWELLLISAIIAFALAYDKSSIFQNVRKHLGLLLSTLAFIAFCSVAFDMLNVFETTRSLQVALGGAAAVLSAVILYLLMERFFDSLPADSPLLEKPEAPPVADLKTLIETSGVQIEYTWPETPTEERHVTLEAWARIKRS